MKILYSPNMRHVYLAGNEFGETHYIVAGSYEDAYSEYLSYYADKGQVCDHGGHITDIQRWAEIDGGTSTCDCTLTDDGKWVWDVYLWVYQLVLSVDIFLLAADDLEAA